MTLREKVLGVESHWMMGRVMPRDLLKGIGGYLEHVAPDRQDELTAAIRARAEELVDAHADMISDEPSKARSRSPRWCWRRSNDSPAVRRRRAPHDPLPAVRDGHGAEAPVRVHLQDHQRARRPARQDRQDVPRDGGLVGAGWDMEVARPEPGLFEMKVGRCFFHDFFARHDAALVTAVMCAWDVNWMQAIDPAVSGLRAERTSLLSLGDDRCRFAVVETDDPLDGYADLLDQRFVDREASG